MNKFGGFLIFLSIIILCGVALLITNPLKKMTDYNDKTRVKDLQKISVALEKYYANYSRYPSHNEQNYTIFVDDEAILWGTPWEPYVDFLPKDPSGMRRYIYVSSNADNYQSFRLYASLEDPASQKQACSVAGECSNVPGENLCGEDVWPIGRQAACNFGVTSSNVSP